MYIELPYPFHISAIRSAIDYHWDSEFQFLGESHPHWELVCVLDGLVEVAEDEKIYTLSQGDFICHASMEFHRIRSAGGSCPHVLIVSFDHEGSLPGKLTEGVFSLNPTEQEIYKTLFSKIYDFCYGEKDPYVGAEAAFSLGNFLIHLGKKQARGNRRSKSRAAASYQLLVETMRSSVRENLTLQDISERTGISISTMKNLFRTYASMSPKFYYAQMRGYESMRLLERGLEIHEVVETMHYSSPNYFSLSFKKQFGVPPGKYCRDRNG